MAYEEIFDLSFMDAAKSSAAHGSSKCQYLTRQMACMVGGDAHALCFREHFHTQCPWKQSFHQKYPHKKIHHPADK